ncbi:hypothetical protein OZX72_05725 [Bifidobacterium sp. ESL0769]|uniref:hypothetical protein n=1 Tax=Bifidobacterium sp. ESL0769 TaxID=2983229 RepID=UPI0023F658B4|nr:hypothetical protein [Bifidobacterium sp. ESL0769]WEV66767.1 hypothetical protein OZX72_05725 [Bifidobacterium sp. ESL0769]
MKSSKLMRAAAAVLCAALALAGLSACDATSSTDSSSTSSSGERTEPQSSTNENKETDKPAEPQPVMFSKIFAGKQSIWFLGDSLVRIGTINDVLIFDQGKVTTYSMGGGMVGSSFRGYTYGDFKGVSEDQLVAKIKELNADVQKQNGRSYQEPTPADYTLSVHPSMTGNTVDSETLKTKYYDPVSASTEDLSIKLQGDSTSSLTTASAEIYDKTFTGVGAGGTLNFTRMISTGDPIPPIPQYDDMNTPGVTVEN